jgi:hypothetical protein
MNNLPDTRSNQALVDDVFVVELLGFTITKKGARCPCGKVYKNYRNDMIQNHMIKHAKACEKNET